jgi:hypothetical protein
VLVLGLSGSLLPDLARVSRRRPRSEQQPDCSPWRGRGVFRALVGHRAVLARNRGFRYLQVDAMPASRPILRRMGFHPLAETTPWMYEGGGS